MTKSEAQQKAEALAKQLGDGWKPRVWDNLGWHYSAVKGYCQVHINSDRSYTCYANATKQFIGRGKTPTDAYHNSLSEMYAYIQRLQKELDEMKGAPKQ